MSVNTKISITLENEVSVQDLTDFLAMIPSNVKTIKVSTRTISVGYPEGTTTRTEMSVTTNENPNYGPSATVYSR